MSMNEGLSRRERQIMDAVYARGQATVAEVQAGLPDAPSYNSVRNLLKILEDKGHLTHQTDGVRYVYIPREATATAARGALARVVRTFFSGSVERAVSTLLSSDEARLTDEEAARIAEIIEQATKRAEVREGKTNERSSEHSS